MDRRESESRKVNRRYRRAAESLWENSSLRDELNDDQAQKILDWASAYLKEVADETAGLPDEEAGKILETKTDQVSSLMRQVNMVIKAARNDDQQELLSHYMLFAKKLAELAGLPESSLAAVENKLSSLEAADRPSAEAYGRQISDEMMTFFNGEEE